MPSNGLNSLLWFIAIVALIPLVLWLLKRSPAGARFGGGTSAGAMRQIATLPLATGQRIVTVEVGQGEARCWLVLGVTANSITTLHTLAPQAEPVAIAAPPLPGFAQMLASLRRDKGSAGEA